ncbi:MAG: guanylate kinase [Gemmatimonadota bacterium]
MNPFPLILSSPSGGGKSTIARRLLQKRNDLGYSVSCTTRTPRPGEVDGRDYHFLEKAEFRRRIERGDFAEWEEVHGNLYGTLVSEVNKTLEEGRHVVMDIDVRGALQFKKAFPTAVRVFVLPPSAEVLVSRLTARNTELTGEVLGRLRRALEELREVQQYEYVVVNDDLDRAVDQVSAIVDAEAVRHTRLPDITGRVEELIAGLGTRLANHN